VVAEERMQERQGFGGQGGVRTEESEGNQTGTHA
jgi:hypothetical protein